MPPSMETYPPTLPENELRLAARFARSIVAVIVLIGLGLGISRPCINPYSNSIWWRSLPVRWSGTWASRRKNLATARALCNIS